MLRLVLNVLVCAMAFMPEIVVVYTQVAGAQEVDQNAEIREKARIPSGEKASLAYYLKIIRQNNPQLKAAYYRWQASLQKAPQVTALPDPNFTYGYFVENVETRVGPQRHKIGISQKLPWKGKLRLKGDIALESAGMTQAQYEDKKLKLECMFKKSYFEYYYVGKVISTTREHIVLLKEVENVVTVKYQTQGTSHSHLVKIQVEIDRLQDKLETIYEFKQPIVAKLNAILGRGVAEYIPVPENIDVLVKLELPFSEKEMVNFVKRKNPELKRLSYQVGREKLSVDLARKKALPDFKVGLQWIYTGHAVMQGLKDSGKDPIIFTVGLNLPIFRKKYRAMEMEAKASYFATISQRQDKQNDLVSQVQMLLYRYRDAVRKIELYRDKIIPSAEESLKVTVTSFEVGRSSFLDMIDAEKTLLEFHLSYHRALADCLKATAEIEMITDMELM